MAQPLPTDFRELRLAMVMTGGVSLAVWMGGVAAEVYRCINDDGLYGDLARLTKTKVVVDVMSGSSAGGLNGAFLGTAISYGLTVDQFDGLRDLWLEVGSFSELLRNPMKKDPSSLLRGDDFFTVKINDILSRWLRGRTCVLTDDDELTVILTASLLSAEVKEYADDFDTKLLEPIHQARFTFKTDHFRQSATLAARLSLAARTTASFPGAFEASYIPIGESKTLPLHQTADGRPDMDDVASFPRSHWAVDGGVLVNKPVRPALDAIVARSSKSEVRRVIAYINPDPGSPTQEIDVQAVAPTLGDVLLKSVVTLPRAESIADHLDELRSLNHLATDIRDLRDALLRGVRVTPVGATAGVGPTDPMSDAALQAVTRRQIDVVSVARELYPFWVKQCAARAVSDRIEAPFARARLKVSYREFCLALTQARGKLGILPPELPEGSSAEAEQFKATVQDATRTTPSNLAEDAVWQWGLEPLDYLADLALDLIHRCFGLLPLEAEADEVRIALGAKRETVHEQLAKVRTLHDADHDYWESAIVALVDLFPDDVDCAPTLAQHLYRRRLLPPNSVRSPALLDRSGTMDEALSASTKKQLAIWRDFVDLVLPNNHSWDSARVSLLVPSTSASRGSDDELAATLRQRAQTVEMEIARGLATCIAQLAPLMSKAIELYRNHGPRAAQEAVDPKCIVRTTDPAQVLLEICAGLQMLTTTADVDEQVAPGASADEDMTPADGFVATLLHYLFCVYVVHACTDGDLRRSPRMELIQVSAFSVNAVDKSRTRPDEKVAGLQVGHFGGFLKTSWRANDWMWGAMDGAARLISILIDPARLRQRYRSSGEAFADISHIFRCQENLSSLIRRDRMFLTSRWEKAKDEIRAELCFLDAPGGTPLPTRLDKLCAHATYVAQLIVAQAQLPVVARAVTTSTREGGDESIEAIVFVEATRMALEQSTPRRIGAKAPSTVHTPRRRLLLSDTEGLLTQCKVGLEKASVELSSDLGAATAAKAAAVAAAALSGTQSGLGPLIAPAKVVRTAVLGVYFTTAAALRKTKIGVAVTFLLLSIGAGAVAVRILGGDVPSPVLAAAILLLAVWVLYTGASAKAWWASTLAVLVLVVVALSFIEAKDVCSTFASTGCGAFAQPGWKDTVPTILRIVFILTAISCLITALRFLFTRAVETQLIELGVAPDRPLVDGWKQKVIAILANKVTVLFVATAAFAALAWVYPEFIHSWFFEGDRDSLVSIHPLVVVPSILGLVAVVILLRAYIGEGPPRRVTIWRGAALVFVVAAAIYLSRVIATHEVTLQRADIIDSVRALADNRTIVTLVGIPGVFIALEYIRLIVHGLHNKANHRNALIRLRSRTSAEIKAQ